MSTSDLLISVVIPAYNYAKTLPRAVESVITQLSEHSELLVIDDGSTDETPAVLTELQARYPGQFRSIRKPNGGLSSVRNRGIAEALGSYLIFLDADDELAPDAMRLLSEHLEHHRHTRMVIGGHWAVWPDGKRRKHLPTALPDDRLERLRGYLLDKTIGLANGASAIHRDVFRLGNYPENFRNAEDIPVFSQALANFECTVLAAPMALIYKHGDSMRHDIKQDCAVGLAVVEEVFDRGRVPAEMAPLRKAFKAQRCLSLFRGLLNAGRFAEARGMYRQAIDTDWRVIFKTSYTRKALRLWLSGTR
ncbi:MAG: glycosyltransferase family 2 protein [Gammaproteobacteria bacterium HGW-Gammaproteobacteria-9]|jgi:glycosyltransferase involved in cell wall biosynthesis|uniref:glycosyltransferase family 2 protein n=1 Tax=Pseudomonas sp. (strain SCT) TaxID=412955 RepID=UPI000CA8FCBB|nr:glycosyltransferase family 2 protein [Pseudomonas sp. SCT]PKM00786.1 MAG: glycosyltransferase family 2 protein [Gammaproteobacteria bacterium HGW-Gammaproteobacteria-9]GCA54332.1 hyaluronan synthase [Pseudomonas sp. SCT]